MIDHRSNGYLVEYKSSDDLTKGLLFILSSGAEYQNLSKNARQKVMDNYSPEAIAKRHIKLYKQLLA